jgi:spore maturation protein CgeB
MTKFIGSNLPRFLQPIQHSIVNACRRLWRLQNFVSNFIQRHVACKYKVKQWCNQHN